MEIVQSAIQYASWPVVTLLALLIFNVPLRKVLHNLRFVKAGSIEVGFGEQLQHQGFTDSQLKVIRDLSALEVDLFLLVSFSDLSDFRYVASMDYPTFRKAMYRLQDAGLMQLTNVDDAAMNILHNTTSAGRRVRAMLINSTVAIVHAAP